MFEAFSNLFVRPALELTAKPGLMTLLDFALYRSVEGELTASVCAAHALVYAWLDLKQQARVVLKHDATLVFARHCLEAACDALEKISTDRFAASANLSEAYETSASFSSTTLSGQIDIGQSLQDTGRRTPVLRQRPRDCWETARLIAPDHVWADDVFLTGQRLIRHLIKQLPVNIEYGDEEGKGARQLGILIMLVQQDLPTRLHQFRVATEANAVVLKRLYLVKCEYRAPFRAFLEAHQTVQRAPSLELVKQYLTKSKDDKVIGMDDLLQELLETPELVEALQIEKLVEGLEEKMAQGIYGFTELARLVDHKRARLREVPGVVEEEDLQPLLDLLRRLRCCLCRKVGPETSSGIRPLLLDLQGVSRDEGQPFYEEITATNEERIEKFLAQLQKLALICQSRQAFAMDRKSDPFDVPSSIVKECSKLDAELWQGQCLDWLDLVKRQQELAKDFDKLSETIRKAEMEAGIQAASTESLGLVQERLERLSRDRELRFEVLKDMVEEVCAREMNWKVLLKEPVKDCVLELPSTSVVGLVGYALQLAGEPLPLG